MNKANESLSVVVMTFNEANSLQNTVLEILDTLRDKPISLEILIVNDGSTDGSHELAENLTKDEAVVRVVHHKKNLGLGEVYRTGFREASKSLITFLPADGQFPASNLGLMLEKIQNHDLVLGHLEIENRSLWARVLSGVERILYRLLLGFSLPFQGLFLTRTRLPRELNLQSTGRGWAIVIEFFIKASRQNVRIANIATTLRPRSSGYSKVRNLPTILSNFAQMVRLREFLQG